MNNNFNENIIKIIKRAKKEMMLLKHPYVGSDHLFLAILSNKNINFTKVLNKYGINYETFKEELIKVVGVGSKASHWFLFTPLVKKILNNYVNYKNDNLSDGDALILSIIYSGDGIAKRILFGMNIDLYELFSLYDLSVLNNNSDNLVFLNQIGFNMNNYFKNSKNIVYERDNEINLITQTLLKKNRNNILLIGPAGVGKTAIVEELSRRISNGLINSRLKDLKIYSISLFNLVSDTKYRGEFEEKFKKLLMEIDKKKDIVLFIDEFHTIIGAGAAEGSIDASNILKPYLANGSIKVIGATTIDEYNKYLKNEKAICRRFQIIKIEEIERNKVSKLFFKIKSQYEEYYNVIIDDEILNLIISLGYTYFNYLYQPDSLIDFLDTICAYSLTIRDNINNNESIFYNNINNKLEKYKYLDKLIKENETNNNMKLIYRNKFKISKDCVYQVLYQMTNVACGSVLNSKISLIKKHLIKEYFWEKNIILEILDCIHNIFNKTKNFNKILFIGKQGVGKREIIKYILDNIFNKSCILKVNDNSDLEKSFLNNINYPLRFFICNFLFKSSFNFINNRDKYGFNIFISIIDSNDLIGLVKNNDFSDNYDYIFQFFDFDYKSAKKYINNLIDSGVCKYNYSEILKKIDKDNITVSNINKLCYF